MGYRLNRLTEPVFIAVSKLLLTEFGIHYRLESCVSETVQLELLYYFSTFFVEEWQCIAAASSSFNKRSKSKQHKIKFSLCWNFGLVTFTDGVHDAPEMWSFSVLLSGLCAIICAFCFHFQFNLLPKKCKTPIGFCILLLLS